MRSEGFSFYIWGSGGWPVFAWPCFWRPQPSATVFCDRHGRKVAVPMGKVARTWLFWRVRSCGHGVLRGRRGTSWQHVSRRVKKSFFVAGAILLLHFQLKMCCIFRGRRSTLDPSDVIFRGRRSTLDVSCCVFSVNLIVSAARSGDKVQIPWQAWHFVTCHENRWKFRTKCRICSRSKRKLVGKRWFRRCEVWKLPCLCLISTCYQMCSCHFAWLVWHFVTFHMCEVQDCREAEVAVPMGKSAKTYLFRRVTRCAHVILRGWCGTLWHSICVRCKTVVRLKLPCQWEKSHKRVFFDVSEDVVTSFCVAGVTLCDITHVWGARPSWGWSCRAYGKNCTNVSVSTCQKMCFCRLAWHAWHFVTFHVCEAQDCREAEVAVPMGKSAKTYLFRRVTRCAHVILRGWCGTLWHSICVRCKTVVRLKSPCQSEKSHKRVFFDVSEDVLMSLCVASVALCDTPHFTLHTPHFTLHTLHSTLHTLQSTLQTLHSTLHTPHSNSLHSTLYTLHSTLHTFHTLHSTLYIPHFTLDPPHSTIYTSHFTLSTPHSTLYAHTYTPHFTLPSLHSGHASHFALQFTLHTPHSPLHTSHSTLHTLHFPLHTSLSTLHTLHSTLYSPHFTLCTPHSPLHTSHSTLYTPHSTLHTFHTLHSTLYIPHFARDPPHSTL